MTLRAPLRGGARHGQGAYNAAMSAPSHRAGHVAVLGRPNVGKSTLINALVGAKVSIVSPRPQTTRHRMLGIATFPEGQLVLVDTPGIHADKGVDAALLAVSYTHLDVYKRQVAR